MRTLRRRSPWLWALLLGGCHGGGGGTGASGTGAAGTTSSGATEVTGATGTTTAQPTTGASTAGASTTDTGTTGAPPDEACGIPNLIDWAAVAGVEGGIPERATICADLAALDGTGVSDVGPAIQAALDACPPEQTVRLPEGTFRVDGDLNMRARVTLRGAGAKTVLRPSGTIHFTDGLSRVNVDLVGDAPVGATTLTLQEAPPGLTVGSSVMLNELNDPEYVHPYGYEEEATLPLLCSYCDEPDGGARTRGQMVRITAIEGATIAFTPALYSPYSAAREPRINYPQALGAVNLLAYAGIESLAIDPTGPGSVISFVQAQNCWLREVEIEITADDAPAVLGYFAHRVNIQHGRFTGHAPTSQAILSQIHTEGWLVEDNIFEDVSLTFLNVGRQGGHVFAYNYLNQAVGPSTALLNDNGNHGSHPQFLLYEGNKLPKHHADSIHGSSSHTTLFRNHFRCREPDTTFGAGCVWIDSWNYEYNVVGNVLGLPGMTGWVYEIESPAPIDQTLYVFRFGYSGYNPYMAYPRSKTSTFRHGNFDYGTNAVAWDEGTAERCLPPSLYLDERPGWFGAAAWPPLGPDVDGYVTELPAELRFLARAASR